MKILEVIEMNALSPTGRSNYADLLGITMCRYEQLLPDTINISSLCDAVRRYKNVSDGIEVGCFADISEIL